MTEMKKWRRIWLAAACSVLISQAAFGAGWRQEESTGGQRGGMRMRTEAARLLAGTGWMASDTVTPDGYRVNADEAWVEKGTVMTRTEEQKDKKGEAMLPITIEVGSKEFEAELYDNETAREVLSRLPMTIVMEELNGNEKYYNLSESLPADPRDIGSIHEGDLMLFGSDCLVLFYKDFQTSYKYTRLGSVKDAKGLSGALGRGNVTVTFR